MVETMNQTNEPKPQPAQYAKETVRVDIRASGNPQDATALAVLIAKVLKERLPDIAVEVLGQDTRIQAGLDSEDLTEVFQFDFGSVNIVADQTQIYDDPLVIENLQHFHAPMEATPVSHERSLRFLRENSTVRMM